MAPLEIAAGGMVAIGEDVKSALDLMRPTYALYVGGMGARGKNFYNNLAVAYGYEDAAREIQDLFLDGKHREAAARVPLEWLEAGNLVGPASYVRERIAAFAEAGVTNLQVTPVPREAGGDPRGGDRTGQGVARLRRPHPPGRFGRYRGRARRRPCVLRQGGDFDGMANHLLEPIARAMSWISLPH